MSNSAFHNKAKLALARLIVKLHLLEKEEEFPELLASEHGPLRYYADKGFFVEDDAARLLAEHLKIPLVVLSRAQQTKTLLLFENPELKGVALAKWKEMLALPFNLESGRLTLIMANPLDHESKSALEFELGLKIHICLGLEELGSASGRERG